VNTERECATRAWTYRQRRTDAHRAHGAGREYPVGVNTAAVDGNLAFAGEQRALGLAVG
jgi:hypothetical protein